MAGLSSTPLGLWTKLTKYTYNVTEQIIPRSVIYWFERQLMSPIYRPMDSWATDRLMKLYKNFEFLSGRAYGHARNTLLSGYLFSVHSGTFIWLSIGWSRVPIPAQLKNIFFHTFLGYTDLDFVVLSLTELTKMAPQL